MCYMKPNPSRVGVRELRQNLSVYLQRVKRGETLSVSEHNRIVAVLKPVPAMNALDRLVAEGRATPATRPFANLGATPKPKLKKPLSALLNDLRADSI